MLKQRAPQFNTSRWKERAAAVFLRMLEQAYKNKEANVATRIPLLKFGFLGKPAMHGPSTEFWHGLRQWNFHPGQILPDPNDQWICWFNDHNAHNGIQAIGVRPKMGESIRYLVVSGCKVYWVGDLRLIIPPQKHSPVLGAAYGKYDPYAHQVLIDPKASPSFHLNIGVHEVEHALTVSSIRMAGSSHVQGRNSFHVDLEYLSMISELRVRSNPGIASLFLERKASGSLYYQASKRFVKNLVRRYGMKYGEIRAAVKCAHHPDPEQHMHKGFEPLVRMKDHARAEYERIYEKFLGLPLMLFYEVVDSLPII